MLENEDCRVDIQSFDIPQTKSWLRENWLKVLGGVLLVGVLGVGVYFLNRYLSSATDQKAIQLLEQAQQAYEAQAYSQALNLYQQAIDYRPSLTEAYLGQAQIYLLKNRSDEAEEILVEGLSRTADKRSLSFSLGQVALQEKDYEAAVDYFSQAGGRRLSTQLGLAEAYLQLGDLPRADDAIRKARQVDKESAEVRYCRAVLLGQENLDSAVEEVTAAVELSSGESATRTRAVRLKESLSMAKEADEESYQKVLLGYALWQEGYFRLSLAPLSEVVQANSSYRDAEELLGAAYLQLGGLDAALEHLDRALQIDPHRAHTHYLLGKVHAAKQETVKAQEAFSLALVFSPNELIYYDAYLEFFESRKDYEAMESLLDEVITSVSFTDDEVKSYQVKLAYLYLDQLGRIQEGLQIAQQFRDTEVYAWALHKNEQSEGALVILQALIEQEPTAWLYYHLGEVQLALGMSQESGVSLARAADLDLEGAVTDLLEN